MRRTRPILPLHPTLPGWNGGMEEDSSPPCSHRIHFLYPSVSSGDAGEEGRKEGKEGKEGKEEEEGMKGEG